MQILDKVNVVVQRNWYISTIQCKTTVCFTLQQGQGIQIQDFAGKLLK